MADEIRKEKSTVSPSTPGHEMANGAEMEAAAIPDEKKKSIGMKLKAIWKKTGLSPAVILIMAK